NGTWFYHGVHTGAESGHTHTADPALAARIERAFAAFGRTRIERQFALDRDGAAYGLATPEILVLVYRPQQAQPLRDAGGQSCRDDDSHLSDRQSAGADAGGERELDRSMKARTARLLAS